MNGKPGKGRHVNEYVKLLEKCVPNTAKYEFISYHSTSLNPIKYINKVIVLLNLYYCKVLKIHHFKPIYILLSFGLDLQILIQHFYNVVKIQSY